MYRELAAGRQYWEAYLNQREEEITAAWDLTFLTRLDEPFNWTSSATQSANDPRLSEQLLPPSGITCMPAFV